MVWPEHTSPLNPMISPFPDVNANPSPLESETADAVPELLWLFLDAGAEPAELLGFSSFAVQFQ